MLDLYSDKTSYTMKSSLNAHCWYVGTLPPEWALLFADPTAFPPNLDLSGNRLSGELEQPHTAAHCTNRL
jgi:hypothetical protein